jgi:hypothetical protein
LVAPWLIASAGRDENDASLECPSFRGLRRPKALERVTIDTAQPAKTDDHFEYVDKLLDPSLVIGSRQVLTDFLIELGQQEFRQLRGSRSPGLVRHLSP